MCTLNAMARYKSNEFKREKNIHIFISQNSKSEIDEIKTVRVKLNEQNKLDN